MSDRTTATDTNVGDRHGLLMIVTYGSSVLIILFLIKAYGVARYSLTTTAALVTTAPGSAALGTLAIFSYLVMPFLVVIAGWFLLVNRKQYTKVWWPLLAALAVIAFLLSPLSYLAYLGGAVFIAIVLEGFVWYLVGHPGKLPRMRWIQRAQGLFFIYLAAIAFTAFFVTTIDSPWLPAEVVWVSGSGAVTHIQAPDAADAHEKTPEVYVVGEDNGFMVALAAENRAIVHIPDTLVKARYICHDDQSQLLSQRPFLWFLQGKGYDSPNLSCSIVQTMLHDRKVIPLFPAASVCASTFYCDTNSLPPASNHANGPSWFHSSAARSSTDEAHRAARGVLDLQGAVQHCAAAAGRKVHGDAGVPLVVTGSA
jgi:hypothetical protein